MRDEVVHFKSLLSGVFENHGSMPYKNLTALIDYRIDELRKQNDDAGRLIFMRNQGQIAALKWVREFINAERPEFPRNRPPL